MAASQVKPSAEDWEIHSPYKGFYTGVRCPDNTRLFIFYNHPQWGQDVLPRGKILHTNELTIYAYGPKSGEVTLTFKGHLLREKTIEIKTEEGVKKETIREPYDWMEKRVKVTLHAFQFDKFTVELPSSWQLRYWEIYYRDSKVFEFKQLTYKGWMPQLLLAGWLFQATTGYVFGTVITCFLALGVARFTIGRIKYVLDMPVWALMVLPIMLIVIFS